jgi:ankyrin repeat protein
VRTHDSQGTAALVYAVGTGNLKVVTLLLDRGADAHASGKKDEAALGEALSLTGFTPLHRAVQKGHVDAATRLIASGADANAAATDGTTALDLASNDREMEALIRRHAKN